MLGTALELVSPVNHFVPLVPTLSSHPDLFMLLPLSLILISFSLPSSPPSESGHPAPAQPSRQRQLHEHPRGRQDLDDDREQLPGQRGRRGRGGRGCRKGKEEGETKREKEEGEKGLRAGALAQASTHLFLRCPSLLLSPLHAHTCCLPSSQLLPSTPSSPLPLPHSEPRV